MSISTSAFTAKPNDKANRLRMISQTVCKCLLTAIAAAHALVSSLTGAAILAGFDLNGIQRTVFLIATMISTTGHTAADIGVRLFLRHVHALLK